MNLVWQSGGYGSRRKKRQIRLNRRLLKYALFEILSLVEMDVEAEPKMRKALFGMLERLLNETESKSRMMGKRGF